MKPAPMLADSWEHDGKTWVFKLRPGVMFHNGVELTAYDVVRSYEALFVAADRLGLPWEDREELFRRMAFNVLAGECDDHVKNVSFLLREGGAWRLAPAYDLTGSRFPTADPWSAHGGVHQLAVNGKFAAIGEADLLRVADRFGIGTASDILARVRAAVADAESLTRSSRSEL